MLKARGKVENIGYKTSRFSLDMLVREGIFEEMMFKLNLKDRKHLVMCKIVGVKGASSPSNDSHVHIL